MTRQHPDSLRAVLDSVFAAPEYRWSRRPDPLATLNHLWASFKQWFFDVQDAHPRAFEIVLYVVAALLLVGMAHAAWTFFRIVRTADSTATDASGRLARHDESWYRDESARLAATGRFTEAIQADFLALVLALDARDVLRFHPSKTPGEYARESRLAPAAREDFRDLVRRLYRYAFARTPCGPEDFAAWRALAAPERYASAN